MFAQHWLGIVGRDKICSQRPAAGGLLTAAVKETQTVISFPVGGVCFYGQAGKTAKIPNSSKGREPKPPPSLISRNQPLTNSATTEPLGCPMWNIAHINASFHLFLYLFHMA